MQDTADKLQVQTYVWTNKNDPNLYGDWDFEVNSSSSSSYVSSIIKFCYPFCIMKWTGYGHELSFNSLPFNLLNWCIEMGDTQSVNFFPVDFLSLQIVAVIIIIIIIIPSIGALKPPWGSVVQNVDDCFYVQTSSIRYGSFRDHKKKKKLIFLFSKSLGLYPKKFSEVVVNMPIF